MDQAAIGHIEQQIDGEVKKRFPGAVRRVAVLQYGDDPVIEPGGLLVRVIIEAPEGREGQQEALQAFEKAHGPALKHFRHDLSAQLPEARAARVPHQRHRRWPAAGAGGRQSPRLAGGPRAGRR